jgi:hypothetical protein
VQDSEEAVLRDGESLDDGQTIPAHIPRTAHLSAGDPAYLVVSGSRVFWPGPISGLSTADWFTRPWHLSNCWNGCSMGSRSREDELVIAESGARMRRDVWLRDVSNIDVIRSFATLVRRNVLANVPHCACIANTKMMSHDVIGSPVTQATDRLDPDAPGAFFLCHISSYAEVFCLCIQCPENVSSTEVSKARSI